MISIIVPVYKVEPYLRRCVDSLLAQTYKDIEIILVDDGSPDNCPAICDEYAQKDSRIKVLHKANGGLSSARNSGMAIAKGEYIGFIDSDDYVEPMMYESLLKVIEEHNADIAMCGCKIVSESGVVTVNDNFQENAVYQIDDIISKFILTLKTASWNKLYRKSSISDVQFPSGRIHGEDLVFIMNVLTSDTKLATISYLGYNYIKRENSITTGAFKQSSFDEVWCKDVAYDQMKKKFPRFENQALMWSFRARQNIIRKISKLHNKQLESVKIQYIQWLNCNYYKIVYMPLKWKLEYFIMRFAYPIYKLIY